MTYTRLVALISLTLLQTASAIGGTRPAVPTLPGVQIAVQNASFEEPNLKSKTWTTQEVPGWEVLPGMWGGVWQSGRKYFMGSGTVVVDGDNTLWLSSGGVSQVLPVRLQALTDYSFSLVWYRRKDLDALPLVMQFVARGQVLASCIPDFLAANREPATVTLVYHSDGSSPELGQPLSVQIIALPGTTQNISQVNVDDVQVTFTDRAADAPISITQECSVTILK